MNETKEIQEKEPKKGIMFWMVSLWKKWKGPNYQEEKYRLKEVTLKDGTVMYYPEGFGIVKVKYKAFGRKKIIYDWRNITSTGNAGNGMGFAEKDDYPNGTSDFELAMKYIQDYKNHVKQVRDKFHDDVVYSINKTPVSTKYIDI